MQKISTYCIGLLSALLICLSTNCLYAQGLEELSQTPFFQAIIQAAEAENELEFQEAVRKMEIFRDTSAIEGSIEYYVLNTSIASVLYNHNEIKKAYPLIISSYDGIQNASRATKRGVFPDIYMGLALYCAEEEKDNNKALQYLLRGEQYSKSHISDGIRAYNYVNYLYRSSELLYKMGYSALALNYIERAQHNYEKNYERIFEKIGKDGADILETNVLIPEYISILNSLVVEASDTNDKKAVNRYLTKALDIVKKSGTSLAFYRDELLRLFNVCSQHGYTEILKDLSRDYIYCLYKHIGDANPSEDDYVKQYGVLSHESDSLGFMHGAHFLSKMAYTIAKGRNISYQSKQCAIFSALSHSYVEHNYLESLDYLLDLLKLGEKRENQEWSTSFISDAFKIIMDLMLHVRYCITYGNDTIPILSQSERIRVFNKWDQIYDIGINVLGKNVLEELFYSLDPGPDYRTYLYGSRNDKSFLEALAYVYDEKYSEAVIELDKLAHSTNLDKQDYETLLWRVCENMYRYASLSSARLFINAIASYYEENSSMQEWVDQEHSQLIHWADYKTDNMLELMGMGESQEAITIGKDIIEVRERFSEIDTTYVNALQWTAHEYVKLGDYNEALILINKAQEAASQYFPEYSIVWFFNTDVEYSALDGLGKTEEKYNVLQTKLKYLESHVYPYIQDNPHWCYSEEVANTLFNIAKIEAEIGKQVDAQAHMEQAAKIITEHDSESELLNYPIYSALLDIYLDVLKEHFAKNGIDSSMEYLIKVFDILKTKNKSIPVLIYQFQNDKTAFSNALMLMSRNPKIDENKCAEDLIEYSLYASAYYNDYPLEGHIPLNDTELIQEQSMEYLKYAWSFREIGNLVSAEYFYKKAIEFLEKRNINRGCDLIVQNS